MTTYYSFHKTPIGMLLLLGQENVITEIRFENSWTTEEVQHYLLNEQFFRETIVQLDEYFSGQRKSFTLPLAPKGTVFQKMVWHELQQIPYGTTCSYGEIAQKINNPKACRAVGMANGKNPIPIIIPCHRVIGKNGTLTGFGGGIGVKQQLLDIEQSHRQ